MLARGCRVRAETPTRRSPAASGPIAQRAPIIRSSAHTETGGPASPKSIAETSDDGSPRYLGRPLRSCLARISPTATKSATPATRPTFQASEKGVSNMYSPTTTKQASGRISQMSGRRRGAVGTSR